MTLGIVLVFARFLAHATLPANASKKTFSEWAEQYFRAMRRAHPAPVKEAARWIVQHSRERITVRLVARAVGAHPVVLRREFCACFGQSVHAYLQHARLADALRLLAGGSHDVRSALYTAGWSSPKSLYRAALDVCGKSLHEVRALPPDRLERVLALPVPYAHTRVATRPSAELVTPTASRA
jgi:methylphosphotriester-DNA--protein-cysteine methyltransferase